MKDESLNDSAGGNENPAAKTFLTKPEVAARLRKTTRTIDTWMARGILPYMKIGRSVLFDWEDCQRHLSQYFRISPFNTRMEKKGGHHE